jgi:HAD superfamily hydrolase (TIGR01509 family)
MKRLALQETVGRADAPHEWPHRERCVGRRVVSRRLGERHAVAGASIKQQPCSAREQILRSQTRSRWSSTSVWHNTWMHPAEVVLFDLDCTLTDRSATIALFAKAFVSRFGDRLRFGPDEIRMDASEAQSATLVASAVVAVDGFGYRPRAEVFANLLRVLPWMTRPNYRVLKAFWDEAFPASTCPAVGLFETLEGLRQRGVRLGLVSNGSPSVQQRKIDALGIRPLLSAVVISGAVGIQKPDPRIFETALNAIQARASNAWFVGDHPEMDMAGAREAGLTAVWKRGVHSWPAGQQFPNLKIDQLSDLLQLVGSGSTKIRAGGTRQ